MYPNILAAESLGLLGCPVPLRQSRLTKPSSRRYCGEHLPSPADFAVAAEQAASARAASIVSAHTASQIISIVTVLAADQPAAVAVAQAVVSDALKRPVASSTR